MTMRPDIDPSMPPREFVRSDPRQRRMGALLMAGIVLIALLLLVFGLPALNAWIRTGSTELMLRKFGMVCYSAAALLLIVAACLLAYARRVFRSGQFPPPGTWVMNDTPLRRGDSARAYARAVLVGVACCALLAAYAIILPHWLHARLLPPPQPHAAPAQPAH
jgi:hypothetical protein